MPSSISSSKSSSPPPAGLRHAVVFLTVTALLLVAVEAGARLFVHRISRIEGRVAAEYKAALQVHSTGRPPRQLLLVGNSLLEESMPASLLRPGWLQGWQATRFPIEQTSTLDWTYGLPRLAHDGCRPDVYGLLMSPDYLNITFSRGEYAAFYLLQPRDLLGISSQLQLHPTRMASVGLGIYSKFFALRTDIRKVLLGRTLPGMSDLATLLVGRGKDQQMDQEEYYRQALPRLQALRAGAARTGSGFVLIVHPPSAHVTIDGTAAILRAARDAGIEAVAPAEGTRFSESDFRDSHHLNEAGARKFMQSIHPGLQAALERVVSR